MPLFHEKNSEAFTRELTDTSGNGSQQDELQFARLPLNFFSWNRLVEKPIDFLSDFVGWKVILMIDFYSSDDRSTTDTRAKSAK